MNILATDIDVPMPQIVSNSPTHSLPDVSYTGSEAVASALAPHETADRPSNEMPEVGTTVPVGVPDQSTEGCPSGEFTSSGAIPLPVLHRAVSTDPRLEHTSDDTRPTEGVAFGHNDSENLSLIHISEPTRPY